MAVDLDLLTIPPLTSEREIFDAANGWPDTSSRIFLQLLRLHDGNVAQIGCDPDAAEPAYWIRVRKGDGPWGDWAQFGATVAPG